MVTGLSGVELLWCVVLVAFPVLTALCVAALIADVRADRADRDREEQGR